MDGRTEPSADPLPGRDLGPENDFGTSVHEALARLGGVATRAQIIALVGRASFDRAVRTGLLVRQARGRYALPTVDEAVAVAHRLSGVLCLASGALHHGWATKAVPERAQVSFPRDRRLTAEQQSLVDAHRHDLAPDEVIDGIVTSKELTLVHCLRNLPEDEALAIADSAARSGDHAALARVAAIRTGRGAARVRRIARAANPDAANAFESVLRAIARTVDGLDVTPQRLITSVTPWVRPDLVDEDLRIVLEADSFQWHGGRGDLRADARRYDLLVVDGWLVLRFAWEDVMFDQEFVRTVLVAAVSLVEGRTKAPCERCRAA